VLFYGINPGYDPSKTRDHPITWKIGDSLDYFVDGFSNVRKAISAKAEGLPNSERLHSDCNLIDDQFWPRPSLKGDHPTGRAPYQNHTRNMLLSIGHGGALITNLLFLQAAKPKEIGKELKGRKYKDFEDACWQVHELIFQITQPRVVVTCSSALNEGLRKRLKLTLVPPTKNSGYGPEQRKWHCKQWRGSWRCESGNNREIAVCQVPHMSYYNVQGDYSKKNGVSEWARTITEAGLKFEECIVPVQ